MRKLSYIVRSSAVVKGKIKMGRGALLSYGSEIQSEEDAVVLSNHAMVLENSFIKGTKEYPVYVGQKTVLGHRCNILGAKIGNCCEIGNGTHMDEGVRMGDFCITGEGTYLPRGTVIPAYSVVLGNPYRILRRVTEEDMDMISRMRGNSLKIEEEVLFDLENFWDKENIVTLIPLGDLSPQVGRSLFEDEVEILGDVHLGDHCLIKKGVKIIGDSHGKIHIGDHVEIGEDTVLHLLPGNHVHIKDHAVIGKNCIIHGCTLEEAVEIEEGSIICDQVVLGKGSRVLKNAVVPQRRQVGEHVVLSGNPAKESQAEN